MMHYSRACKRKQQSNAMAWVSHGRCHAEYSGGAENGPAYSAPRSTLERLPTYDAGRKENAMAAVPWAGPETHFDCMQSCNHLA